MKKIEGYDYYYITEDGEVWNCKNKKFICQWIDNVGYKVCVLYMNGRKKYIRLHRLVALYYVPNPNNNKQVNHIDGNKLNNHYTNLEWCTNSQNTKHAFDNGLVTRHKIKCKVNGVIYNSIREASKKTGLNRKTLTRILKGEKQNNYGVEICLVEV